MYVSVEGMKGGEERSGEKAEEEEMKRDDV